MADSTTNLTTIDESQAEKAATANALFDASSPASAFGRNAATCAGLTWGYYGARVEGTTYANGTVTLAASDDNYIVLDRATLAVSVDTDDTDWLDTDNFARLYLVTTGPASVTSYEDHRIGDTGMFPLQVSVSAISPIGLHAVPINAASMLPAAAAGCAALSQVTIASGPDIATLDFDQSTQEHAHFAIPMPPSWAGGTIAAKFRWSHAAGGSAFGVTWGLQALAVADDGAMGSAFGTAQEASDTGGTADDLYTSPITAAITIAGSPAPGDTVFFRVYRKAASDTLDLDARLHSVELYLTTAAATDA